jgi:hypothetical protein
VLNVSIIITHADVWRCAAARASSLLLPAGFLADAAASHYAAVQSRHRMQNLELLLLLLPLTVSVDVVR